jgi:S-adenosylmethionine decarboxylase
MKPFGYSYLVDLYGVPAAQCDDLERHYRFLESLVDALGMTRMSVPVVMHGPTSNGVELFPEKAGVSGWVPLIESGIQIHSLAPAKFITLDVYSCKEFTIGTVMRHITKYFEFESFEDHFIVRGETFNG